MILRFAAASQTALILAAAAPAQAQNYPARPIEMTVAFSPGAVTDIFARALAAGLGQNLGQPVVVINKAGATGALGSAAAARAAPDGYALLFTPAVSITVVPQQNPAVGYTHKSFDPVCQTFKNEMVIVAKSDAPFQSAADIMKGAKSRPGAVSYGHLGIASIPHLAMTELSLYAGVEFNPIPFKGDSEVIQNVMAGQTDFGAVVLSSAVGSGLNILGLFGDTRNPAIPGVATLREQGFDVAPVSFGGIAAPRGLPAPVMARLEQACLAAAQSDLYAKLARSLGQPDDYYSDGAAFGVRLDRDVIEKARLLKALGELK